MKTKALEWINSLYEKYLINDQEKVLMDRSYYFKLEGFADEPEVYLRPTYEGLEFGYGSYSMGWIHACSFPGVYKKHTLTWMDLKMLSKEEQQEMILNLLMKTINSRKRQFRKYQFCRGKVAIEHRFDKDTCNSCASEQYGVVY